MFTHKQKRRVYQKALIILIIYSFKTCVNANPLPIENYGSGTPIIDENTPIQFISEDITYVINYSGASIIANYTFYNPTNETIDQMIIIPFIRHPPFNLRIYSENMGYIDTNKEYHVEFDNETYQGTSFSLIFQQYETNMVRISYSQDGLEVNTFEDPFFFSGKSYTYLARTGSSWNNTINATFTFKTQKDLYVTGLGEFKRYSENEYNVVTKSFTNWIPDRDFEIACLTLNWTCVLSFLLVIILIICILLFSKKRKRNV